MKIIDIYDKDLHGIAPLYNRVGQCAPCTAYIEINPDARYMAPGVNLEPHNSKPQPVLDGRLIWIELPSTASTKGIKDFLRSLMVHYLVNRVCDGHTETVDSRRGRLGSLNADAQEAINILQALARLIECDKVRF